MKVYIPMFGGNLFVFSTKDPAAKKEPQYIRSSYSTFRTIMHYRIANVIYYYEQLNREIRLILSRKISEDAKKDSGVEIHPAAKIGRSFIIDHGYGTVIGETSEIGDDCYLLQGVTLGAREIIGPSGKRHPTLGNNVKIGGFARIFGPIEIGDNVSISPCCVITENIPSDHDVIIVNQLQITKSSKNAEGQKNIEIYGIVPNTNNTLSIYGCNLEAVLVKILDSDLNIMDKIEVSNVVTGANLIILKLTLKYSDDTNEAVKVHEVSLKLYSDKESIIIGKSIGLRRVLENLTNRKV